MSKQLELENIVEEIKAKQQDKQNLIDLYNAKVAELKASLDSKTEQIDRDIHFLTQTARAEFEALPSKETKTQRKIVLLSGEFVVKKPTKKIEADKAILLKWGKENAPDYIDTNVVESFKWADFKKTLQITEDGQIINTETGEVIKDGVEVVDVPEEVIVK